MSSVQDIGAYLNAGFGGGVFATAAGAGDNTEVTSPAIDRLGYRSCSAYVAWTATLADTESLSLAGNLQDCATSGGTYADFGTALANAAVATSSGGSTETGVTKVGDFDLTTANRYIKLQFTPDLSASGTDTAVVSGIVILGGKDVNPA